MKSPTPLKIRTWAFLLIGFMAAFGFRVHFGLHTECLVQEEDEVQVYLIGLKSYATQTWPTHGTDVINVGKYNGQMAGALLGLSISIPLSIWPHPVSPFLFLGFFTSLSLVFLGWYCCKRLPGFSPWFVFPWLAVAPWTTHVSTALLNQSHASIGAILFCVGFMESVPSLRIGALSKAWANALLGFGLLWMAQLHMSWVMFIPLAGYSLWVQWRKAELGKALFFGGLGALPMLALMIPAYLEHGFTMAGNAKGYSSLFNVDNVLSFFTILARYLSFACFELPRFIGPGTHARLEYLTQDPWLVVPGFFLWILGLVQAIVLLFFLWVKEHPRPHWRGIKIMVSALLTVVYVLFWFSAKEPTSFRFPEVLPFVMIYSFYCWDYLAAKKFWRVLGVVFLAAAIYFQVGYALRSARENVSFFDHYKEKIGKAIEAKDHRLLAERRRRALY